MIRGAVVAALGATLGTTAANGQAALDSTLRTADGKPYVPSGFSQLLSTTDNGVSARRETQPFDELSRREREVFDLILRGYTNQRIARTLFISVKTVETHRSHINRKLHVHSTGELIRLSALSGLLEG